MTGVVIIPLASNSDLYCNITWFNMNVNFDSINHNLSIFEMCFVPESEVLNFFDFNAFKRLYNHD